MKAKKPEEIFVLSNDKATALPVRAMKEGLFGTTLEDAFQKLLERYPEIIPGKQIQLGDGDPPRFLLIRREAPIASWSLDHLLVDQNGVLTLVECKLLQNPESRREVVGQIIEYASNARVAWGGGQLREFAHSYWSSRGLSFDDAFHETLNTDEETDNFWQRVEENLEQGKIRLIIAGDEIRPEVRRMIEYLNEEMSHVEVLGLELKCFGSEDDQLVLVPSIIGQSVASVDRRRAAAVRNSWTIEELEAAFSNMQDNTLVRPSLKLLSWARDNGRYLQSTGKYPCFGVANRLGNRIIGVYEKDGPWAYFEAAKYESEKERNTFVETLKNAGLLEATFDPETQTQKRLDFSDGESIDKLLEVMN